MRKRTQKRLCLAVTALVVAIYVLVKLLLPAIMLPNGRPKFPSTQRPAARCEGCAPVCQQGDDATTRRVRRLFGAPDGFPSCAVVGSSDVLRVAPMGDAIDAHDSVWSAGAGDRTPDNQCALSLGRQPLCLEPR